MFDYQAFSAPGARQVPLSDQVTAITVAEGQNGANYINFSAKHPIGGRPMVSGWKAHVSVHPDDMEAALNLAVPLILKYGLNAKAVRVGTLEEISDPDQTWQAGKHFTFYENQSLNDEGIRPKVSFIQFLTELEHAFKEHGIRRWEPSPNPMNTLRYGNVIAGQANELYTSFKDGYALFDRPVGTYTAIRYDGAGVYGQRYADMDELLVRYRAGFAYDSLYNPDNAGPHCAFDIFGLKQAGIPIRLDALEEITQFARTLLRTGADETVANMAKEETCRILSQSYGRDVDTSLIGEMLAMWQRFTGLSNVEQSAVSRML
ncbi:hypothetical protein GC177_10120 [bacterium]|nr:hypothetical protein [bacterium]